MAFCPECGKAAAAEASKCVHCGHELRAAAATPQKARFKGTMMMSAPVATPPAAGSQTATPQIATPQAETPQVATPAAHESAASVVPKPALKATMLGAGIAPPSPAGEPGPGEDVQKRKMAFAATQPLQAFVPPTPSPTSAQTASESATAPGANSPDAEEAIAATDGEKKYLPGDPMAPAAQASRQGARHGGLVVTPDQPSARTLIILSLVGMVIIGGIGLGVAKYMGLL